MPWYQLQNKHGALLPDLHFCTYIQISSSFRDNIWFSHKIKLAKWIALKLQSLLLICNASHQWVFFRCDVNVIFGIWKGSPGVYDLLGCIKNDLELKGYDFECQCIGVCDQHIWGQHFCKRPIFEFKFRWWWRFFFYFFLALLINTNITVSALCCLILYCDYYFYTSFIVLLI